MRAGVALLVLTGLAAPAWAQIAGPSARDFDGDWALGDPAACVLGVDLPNMAMRIHDGMMLGYESACRMLNPSPVRDSGAVVFDMACRGEGETWTSTAVFMLDVEGQLVSLWDGYAAIRPRCTGYAPGYGPPRAPALTK